MNDTERLDRALTDLGAHIDLPRESDLASAVRRRIEASPARRLPMRPWVWTRRSIVFAVVLVVLASSIAVASYLAVRGVRIRVGQPPPSATPTAAVGTALGLGERSTLAAARAEVAFPVRVPIALGAPDEVYLGRHIPGYQVTLAYRPRAGLPMAPGTDVGLLLFQFRGRLDRGVLEKVVDDRSKIRPIEVGGRPGIWIEGTHTVGYLGPNDQLRRDTVRLAGNVLLWQIGDVTLRLESALTMADALRIAGSVG